MKDLPLVSVITPLYNRVDLIGETIGSVVHQTYNNWELLIVDDGSTDGSFEYVQSLAQNEPRIKAIQRNREPKGAPTCRNIGIEKAQGDFIIFLDSDDLLAKNCLEQRVECFNKYPDYSFLVFPVQFFKNNIGDMDKIFLRFFYKDYLTSFLLQSHWVTVSPIWKKEAVRRLGGFDEELICMQDGELHVRALSEGLTFKIFKEKSYIDSYLRRSDSYERITNRINTKKLDGMVVANLKMYDRLAENGQLTPIRNTMLAAQFLNICWNYQLFGEQKKSYSIWRMTYEKGMVDKRSYNIGKSFIKIRSNPLIRNSRILAGILKRVYQLFLPKFLLWP